MIQRRSKRRRNCVTDHRLRSTNVYRRMTISRLIEIDVHRNGKLAMVCAPYWKIYDNSMSITTSIRFDLSTPSFTSFA